MINIVIIIYYYHYYYYHHYYDCYWLHSEDGAFLALDLPRDRAACAGPPGDDAAESQAG